MLKRIGTLWGLAALGLTIAMFTISTSTPASADVLGIGAGIERGMKWMRCNALTGGEGGTNVALCAGKKMAAPAPKAAPVKPAAKKVMMKPKPKAAPAKKPAAKAPVKKSYLAPRYRLKSESERRGAAFSSPTAVFSYIADGPAEN